MSAAREGALSEERVAPGVVERLPVYLDCLWQLGQEGARTVSSARLGEVAGVNPAQIRRDLAHFGSFGQRGVGYEVEGLAGQIQRILGADHIHRMALVGAGNLGSAIAGSSGLRKHGFVVSAAFDNDPKRVGATIGGIKVQDIGDLETAVTSQGISIGIIAVPPEAAQGVADRLVGAGVGIILNYSPVMVRVPARVQLHNSDPVHELLYTLYYLSRRGHDDPSVE